ncbi:Uncharacterized membrane protein [Nakamurella panacisegetis]|uniref:Uncharacterized membrane protein n=1 Tax=Nakamurella panacisegetis TaxID=1090615 RepID=A0A1H0KK51_9ACTN|nr:DUF2079 domain-containing protein [Nakamurella panacisegetis]SDO56338.1 Uncharacterized membrane protein [Nakamurella panacisegetis]
MSDTSAPTSTRADELNTTRPQKAVPTGPGLDRQLQRWLPWGVAALLAVFYAAVSIRRHVELLTSAYDLGIYDQAVRSYSHFSLPYNSVQSAHFDVLGDHFSPVLALLAPLYWIHDSPTTLLAAQAVLIAVAVVPLMRWAHRSIGLGAALVVGLGYGLSFGVANAVTFDFHEVAFAAPLIAFAAVALGEGRLTAAVAWAAPLVLVKEDLGLTVAVVGLLVAWRGRRMLGLLTAAGGALGAALAVLVIIPGMNPLGHNNHASKFGTSILHQFTILLSPDIKILTLVFLLAPTVFLAIRSPIIALAVPTVLWRFLATDPNYWGNQFHYSLILMPVIFAAFIDVLRRRNPAPRRIFLLASALVTVYLVPQNGFAQAFTSGLWHTSEATSQVRALLARIPSGTTVAASNQLLPQLSQRDHVTLIGRTPLDVSQPAYIISETQNVGFPLGTDGQNAWLADARSHGYRDIGTAGSVVLLARN